MSQVAVRELLQALVTSSVLSNEPRAVLFLYYYLTTIQDEWQFMWKHSAGILGRIMFFISRYVTLAISFMNLAGLPSGIRNAYG